MALNIQVLSDNRLYPTVFNVVQGSNAIDTVVYTLENYIIGERDLSTYDWYVHLIGVEGVDAVKLTSAIVDGKLQVTFDLTEYVTRLGNTLTYQLVAKDDTSAVWNSAKGVILNAESINADDKIVADYPSILRQWELRIEEMAGSLSTAIFYIPYGETILKEDRMPGRLYYQYLYAENKNGQLEDSNGNILIPEQVAKNIGISEIDGLTGATVQEALQALKVLIENKDSLPAQAGNANKYLRTNGESAEWADVENLPDQTGNEGKYLRTNGAEYSWEDAPRGLPLFGYIRSRHKFNDVSYLRADSFTWHSGDVYVAAYNHLVNEYDSVTEWTHETVGGVTIGFKLMPDGHKITNVASEQYVQSIYEATGASWYYIIDTANKQFKLPREKSDSEYLYFYVGNYVRSATEINIGAWSELAHGVDIEATAAEIDVVKNAAIAEVISAGESISSYQQPLITLAATSGEVSLEINKIYSMAITSDTSFVLPTTVDTNFFNQIKVMAQITGTPTITWGTTYFVNKEAPVIEEGHYDIYFDYDNNLGGWVVGAITKGA